MSQAYLYGADPQQQPGTEGLNAFFLLVDKPEVYNLPPDPVVPTKRVKESWLSMAAAATGMALVALGSAFFSARKQRA
jgi:formate dehydrogenase iron-sulfur subunit